MSRDLIIKTGRVVSPENGIDAVCDVLVRNGKIERVAQNIPRPADAAELDARGLIVIPGVIDMHTHLCEPGREDTETIESGLKAAVHGGVTSVLCMPDTTPAIDQLSVLEAVLKRGRDQHLSNLFAAAALTRGRKETALTEMAELAEGGALAFTNDPDPITDSQVMKRAMEYCSMTGRFIIDHPEDRTLSRGGLINEGRMSSLLGLSGIPAPAEEIMVARDVLLAEMLQLPVHLCHISTKRSVRILRDAKRRGVPVTAETSPQYFCLNEEALENYDTNLKLSPPLRTEEDRREIVRAVRDGTIDAVSSDHTPRTDYEKEQEFDHALPGLVGLETLLPLSYTFLVEKGGLELGALVRALSVNPARILKLGSRGAVAPGMEADLTILNPAERRAVRVEEFYSRSRNTPFAGWELAGFAAAVVVGGRVLMNDGQKIL